MKPDICLYHGPGCADGLVAAWAIWRRWPDIEFVAAQYGQEPPDVAGKHVLIVDFSYKRDVLVRMADSAKYIVVLDHHRTAEADLAHFIDPKLADPATWLARAGGIQVAALFDMDKSGARLAWEYAWPDASIPALVLHVEDRDLWRFALPGTREVHAMLTSFDPDFARVDQLCTALETDPFSFIREGQGILRAHDKNVASMVAATRRRMVIDGHDVPVANLPPIFASDAGNIMARGEPFAATYYQSKDGDWSFSLRSAPDGLDVSEIAARHGGGGHKHAAGLKIEAGVRIWGRAF